MSKEQRAAPPPRSSARERKSVSRSLSALLRHKAEQRGVPIDAEGYVEHADLIRVREFRDVGEALLREVVALSDKQRFTLRGPGEAIEAPTLAIRANQGHSIRSVTNSIHAELSEAEAAATAALHGTYWAAWASIRRQGLSRMGRQHIHFAPDLPGRGGVISGMRGSAEVIITVDVPRAMAAGARFYRSSNGVLLCSGMPVEGGFAPIPPDLFASVVDRQTGTEVER